MRVVDSDQLFKIVEATFHELPDRTKINYLKDVATTLSKYTGGRVGRIGVWCVEFHEIGPTKFFQKAFQFIKHYLL